MIKHWFSDVHAFRHDPISLLEGVSFTNETPFVRLALGPRPVFLVNDSSLAKPLMRLGEDTLDKGALVHKMGRVVGESSLTLSGAAHDARRAILNERLSRGVANSYLNDMTATVTSVLARLASLDTFRADILGGQLALKLACVALFGHGVLSETDELAIMRAFVALEADLQAEMFRFLPRTPWKKKHDLAQREEALQIISTIVAKVEAGASNSSVLSGLQRAGLSSKEVRDELTTMIIAGFHTTGSAVAWLCHYLSTQPNEVERIRDDYNSIQDDSGGLDTTRLSEAKNSIAFVKEVLRLYPSAWWFTREFQNDTQFNDVKFKRGTTLIFSPWIYHRDPRNFASSDQFRLDRNFSGAAYMPFGVGHRACVGMGVAMVELQIIALELAAAFDLRSAPKSNLRPRAGITLNAPEMVIHSRLREPYRHSHERAA